MARPEPELAPLLDQFAALDRADQRRILQLLPEAYRGRLLARVERLEADRAGGVPAGAVSPWLADRLADGEGTMTAHARAMLRACAAELRLAPAEADPATPGAMAWLRRKMWP